MIILIKSIRSNSERNQKCPFCQKEFEAAQQQMETIYYN